MKRYFGLFSKRQMNGITVHSDDEVPAVLVGEPVINANIDEAIIEQEAPVVEHNDNVVDEVNKTPAVDKPKRRRRSKKASDSPSDNQEVGDT